VGEGSGLAAKKLPMVLGGMEEGSLRRRKKEEGGK